MWHCSACQVDWCTTAVVTVSFPALAVVPVWLVCLLTPHQRPGGRRGRRRSPGQRTRRRQTRCWWRGRWGGSAAGQSDQPGHPTRRPRPSSPGTRSDLKGGRGKSWCLRKGREEERNGRGMWWEEIMRERRETEDMIMRYYSSVSSLILLPAITSTLIRFPMSRK